MALLQMKDTSVTDPSPLHGELRVLQPQQEKLVFLFESSAFGEPVVAFDWPVIDAKTVAGNTVPLERGPSTRWDREWDYLSSLKPDWDTYGADAPSERAIETAKSFLDELGENNPDPSRIAPSAEGGVAVTFASGTRTYMIEFFNDGDISTVWSDGRGRVDAEEIMVEAMGNFGWKYVLSKVDEFLAG